MNDAFPALCIIKCFLESYKIQPGRNIMKRRMARIRGTCGGLCGRWKAARLLASCWFVILNK